MGWPGAGDRRRFREPMIVDRRPSRPMSIERAPHQVTLDYYLIALAVLMMLLGLRQWAVILGLMSGPTGRSRR